MGRKNRRRRAEQTADLKIRAEKQLLSFLASCKRRRPNTAVIISGGRIKQKYYLDISPFVGRIVLPDTPYDARLQALLLAHSGTAVSFGQTEITGEDTLVLNLERV